MSNLVDLDQISLQNSNPDFSDSTSSDPDLSPPVDEIKSPQKSGKSGWSVIGVTTLASILLHGLLLLLPLPEKEKPVPPPPEDSKVRITKLPTGAKPGAKPAAKPAAKVPIAKSTPKVTPRLPRLTQRPPAIAPVVLPSPQQPQSPQPQPSAQSQASPTPDAEPVSDANPWQDFPQYPGAESGCYNLPSCMQTSRGLNEVSTYFERELTAKKYSLTPTVTESNRTVYQVSRNQLTQFLSLIEVPGKGTIYVLAEQPRSLADLGDAVEVPAEIYSVLSGLAAVDATNAQFAQPDAFYSGDHPKPEIGIMQVVSGEAPDSFFDSYLRTNLVNNGFDSTQLSQSYGGGLLYEVKKETTSLYINLVPTQDGSGTIVVIWKTLPQ